MGEVGSCVKSQNPVNPACDSASRFIGIVGEDANNEKWYRRMFKYA